MMKNNFIGQQVEGVVREGYGIGKILGFPTINFINNKKIDSGVYFGKVLIEEKEFLAAVCARNFRGEKTLIEAYLINFSENLYGKRIKIELERKIREVKKFNNEDDLKEQIKQDIKFIQELNDKKNV